MPAGEYVLWSRDDFSFTITPTGSNIGKVLHISTSRTSVPDSEGVLITDNQDGSYTVTILRVQEAVIVTIDFVTGNESITGDAVWGYDNRLYIHSEKTGEASVYMISGLLVGKIRTGTGEPVILLFNKGLYVVVLHGKIYKVMVN